MVSSVIYGMVNLWSSVFSLPKQFYTKIDYLCSAFLWKNNTNSARGARVAWCDICRPKSEGGLGIRQLEEFEKVFRLKQIWNLFTNADSLWVAWVNKHVFARKGFWLTEDAIRFSRAIRSMLQVKHLLHNFLRCVLRNGEIASFWHDYWTELGPLIALFGAARPRQLKIPIDSSVIRAVDHRGWRLPPTRSDVAQELQIALTMIPPPSNTYGPDTFLLRNSSGQFVESFSSKATCLRQRSPVVTWSRVV